MSLIDFKAIPVTSIPKTDWIFFSSKNAVRHFFNQGFNLKMQKVGCIGEATFKILSQYIKQVNFCGNDVDIHKTSAEFSKIIGHETCLFPISNISKKTVQQHLSANQVFNMVVYETFSLANFKLPELDVLIFTSPSNVQNYFSKYPINPNQKVIAIGSSTLNELKNKGVHHALIPKTTGELGLIDVLLSL